MFFSAQEVKAFNMMLGRLLNAGYISQARELAALFEHDSPDLTIVLVCVVCNLPLGPISVYLHILLISTLIFVKNIE